MDTIVQDQILKQQPTLKPWLYSPKCNCKYCGRQFKNAQSIKSHLKYCKARRVFRYFILGKYIIAIYGNPTHKILEAIDNEIQRTHNADNVECLIAAFQHEGRILGAFGMELEGWVAELPIAPDGLCHYNILKDRLTKSNMLQFNEKRTELQCEEYD